MRERPILFNAPMVRAILQGRKTQTRRLVKDLRGFGRVTEFGASDTAGYDWHFRDRDMRWNDLRNDQLMQTCPYGQPGDRLWVRETWVELLHTSPATDEPLLCEGDKLIEHATCWTDAQGHKRWNYDGKVIAYRATSSVEFCDGDGCSGEFADRDDMPRWRPSIHMPRWARRIMLEVTGVRVERLQDISESDAIAEGIMRDGEGWRGVPGLPWFASPIAAFRSLWESLNGDGSWDANPFVWVVDFFRAEASDAT